MTPILIIKIKTLKAMFTIIRFLAAAGRSVSSRASALLNTVREIKAKVKGDSNTILRYLSLLPTETADCKLQSV